MKILIVYGSIEGQTAKIAKFVRDELRAAGHEVSMVNSDDDDEAIGVPFDTFDKAVLAASVHERRHPRPFEVFLAGNKRELEAMPTLFLSVSLNAAFPERRDEAEEYVTETLMRTEFSPTAQELVAGAIRPGEYDYFASQVVKHVVLRGRGPGDSDIHEYTDWEALKRAVSTFVADVK